MMEKQKYQWDLDRLVYLDGLFYAGLTNGSRLTYSTGYRVGS